MRDKRIKAIQNGHGGKHTLQAPLQHQGQVLPSLGDWLPQQRDPSVWMVVGPEGGWDERELTRFSERCWQPVHLGDSILRSSTAAVRSAVELVQWRERRV